MEFTTEVTDVDCYHFAGLDDDVACASAIVKWNADIEAREWGIKGVIVYGTSVKCSVTVRKFDKVKDDYGDEEEILIDSSEGWTLETEGTDNMKINDDISPNNVSIDFKDKLITVNF